MESQYDNCIDQATYDGVVAQHQHCLTTEELNQLRDTSTQHQQCPTTEELNQLRDTATQHQQCLSAAEVQMLQDFHSNHNNCVDRGSYDIVFNAHEGCEQQLAEATSLRQEYDAFTIAHQDCDNIAAQLGQLQEEHGRCEERLRFGSIGGIAAQSSPAAGTMGSGGFQVAATPRSQNMRLSTAPPSSPSPTTSGTFCQPQPSPTTPGSQITTGMGLMGLGGNQASPGQSPSAAGTFGPPVQQPPI
jgi:hypothetical protein